MALQRTRTTLLAALALTCACRDASRDAADAPARLEQSTVPTIDRDLLDVTVAKLHTLYAGQRYTVTQVVQWHLASTRR